MADTKISALTDGAPAQGTEDVPVALSGSNYRLTTGDIALLALQDAFQGAITVDAATTAVLAGSPTYANGAAGVGATLTRGSNGVFPTIDGVAAALNNTYLVKNQASSLQNGVYELTTLGSGGAPWVLTRTTDSDQIAELYPQVVIVAAGTVNKRRIYSQTNGALATIGTDAITYGTTPAPNLTGYVKADGTVDFTGAETWDFGGTDTTVISDSAIAISDGTLQGLLQKDLLQISDALGGQAQMTELAVAVASAAGDSTGITSDGLTILRSAGGTMEKKFIKVSLSAAQIKTAMSAPVEIIASAGAGAIIDLISCVAVLTYVSVDFTSALFHLDCGGGNGEGVLYSGPGFLNTTVSVSAKLTYNVAGTDNAVVMTGTPITFMADADSATGDSTIDLYIEYNIITL